MPFLGLPPAPVTAPITSQSKAAQVDCFGCDWLSVGWTASMASAQLTYQVVVEDGSGNRLYISPPTQVTSSSTATDGVFFANGSVSADGVFKIPRGGVKAYVLVLDMKPVNPAPPAAPIVTWTVAGSAD